MRITITEPQKEPKTKQLLDEKHCDRIKKELKRETVLVDKHSDITT